MAEHESGAETVDEGALVEDVAEEVLVSAASKRVRSRFLLVAVEEVEHLTWRALAVPIVQVLARPSRLARRWARVGDAATLSPRANLGGRSPCRRKESGRRQQTHGVQLEKANKCERKGEWPSRVELELKPLRAILYSLGLDVGRAALSLTYMQSIDTKLHEARIYIPTHFRRYRSLHLHTYRLEYCAMNGRGGQPPCPFRHGPFRVDCTPCPQPCPCTTASKIDARGFLSRL